MAQTTVEPDRQAKANWWGAWIAVALVATLGGLLLPQLMPGDVVAAKAKGEPNRASDQGAAPKKKLDYAAPAMPDAPNFQGMLLRLGAGTLIVLALCVATLWGMKRWLQPQTAGNGGQREMQLKDTLHLGNRCALHLVHLGKREVLVGVDAAGIKAVVQLPGAFDDALADALPEESRPRLAALGE